MQLTLQTDYALRILLFLGLHRGELVPVSAVSGAFGISLHHVAKVAKDLTKQGFVRARRGKGGGLELAHEPANITLGVVVRAFEPGLSLLACFDESDACSITGACKLRRVLIDARNAFLEELDGHTLADLLHNEPQLLRLLAPRR